MEYQYLSIQQVADCESYPFNVRQLQYFLQNRHRNGLAVAVRKIGKRL